jgi:regulator of cell morphogenesis and NO signaling
MNNHHRTYLKPAVKMLDLINENSIFLLLLQRFGVDFSVDNKSIKQICEENAINLNAFIVIGNLYNGYYPNRKSEYPLDEIKTILTFLKNSHKYYIKDIYPELKKYIAELYKNHTTQNVQMIDSFFDDYFSEVMEHLKYEDEIAFPYFQALIDSDDDVNNFSVQDYLEHHTDIETKLSDLKNLFLKHLQIKNDLSLKRKFLNSIFELEFDLKLHSIIEESILIPFIEFIENKK